MASDVSRLEGWEERATLLSDAARVAIDWKARTGGAIVGYIGTDVPTEIIAAAGLYPLRIGVPGPAQATELRFFERGDSEMAAQLIAPLLDGSLAYLDHLVIGTTPVANVAVFHFLREARRRRADLPSLPISLHELQHGGDAAAAAYNLDACVRLAGAMERLGSAITDESVAGAIAWANAKRHAAAALAGRRRADAPGISGTYALRALVRAQVIADELPGAADDLPAEGPRILFSGSDVWHLDHYPVIEQAGCVIVADDHDWGEPAFELPVGREGDSLAAIARRYTNRPPRSARWPMRTRIAGVVDRAVQARVQGAVFWIDDEDHASSWDLPQLVAALRARGIATLDLGPQRPHEVDAPAIVARTADWLDTLGPVREERRA